MANKPHKYLCCAFIAGMALAGSASAAALFDYSKPGISPGAFAAGGSFTSLYGTLDEYIDHIKVGNKSINRVLSGGAWTSKIGVYNQEDLGNGIMASINLEGGFNANDGTQQSKNVLFSRLSTVGLRSREWGALQLGRQTNVAMPAYADAFGLSGKISPLTYLSTTAGLGKGAADVEPRVANAVSYTTPWLAGFNAELLYAIKGDSTGGPSVQNRGINLTYKTGRWTALVNYNQVWCDPSFTTCSDPSIRNDIYGAAVLYGTEKLSLSATYQFFAPRLDSDGIARVYSLGAVGLAGNNVLRASLVSRRTTLQDNHALGVSLGDDYMLSKTTGLYTRLSLIKNGRKSAMTIDNGSGSPVVTAGATVTDIAFGLFHNF